MTYKYLIEHEIDFIAFMHDRLDIDLRHQPLDGPNWFCVTVRDQLSDQVVAGLAAEFKSPFDAHLSVAIDDPDVITRRLLRGIFRALFTRAVRITMLVDPANTAAKDQAIRLGGVYEGFLRRGLDGDRDALVYGMLKEDCRYLGVRAAHLNGGRPDGQPAQSAGSLRHRERAAVGERRIQRGQRYH
jgi:hypothetical protein